MCLVTSKAVGLAGGVRGGARRSGHQPQHPARRHQEGGRGLCANGGPLRATLRPHEENLQLWAGDSPSLDPVPSCPPPGLHNNRYGGEEVFCRGGDSEDVGIRHFSDGEWFVKMIVVGDEGLGAVIDKIYFVL